MQSELIATNNTGIAYEAYKKGIPWIAGPYLNIVNSFSLMCLKEKFNWDDGEIQNREWTINKIDENNSWKPYDERQHFVFSGNFLHAPNLDATIQLKKHIWKEKQSNGFEIIKKETTSITEKIKEFSLFSG